MDRRMKEASADNHGFFVFICVCFVGLIIGSNREAWTYSSTPYPGIAKTIRLLSRIVANKKSIIIPAYVKNVNY